MKNANHPNGSVGAGGRLNGAMSKSTLSLMTPGRPHQQPANQHQRKTSAEIVSEAKNMLANGVGGGGARLVSTRRPITPREPRRQLYGKQAPPGRPPSAFSLRYLQFESRSLATLPTLDRLLTSSPASASKLATTAPPPPPPNKTLSKFLRTASVDSPGDSSEQPDGNQQHVAEKLPALLQPPPMLTGSFDDLSDEMPPRMDFKVSRSEKNNNRPPNDSEPTVGQRSSAPANRADTAMQQAHAKNARPDDNQNVRPGKAVLAVAAVAAAAKPFARHRALGRNNDLLAQSSTETLLDLLKAHAGLKECSDETAAHICGILAELYTRVKGARGDWRGAVLGALYGLVECTAARILVSVARVVLVLCVTGSNLTGACKLIFKVARSETNDMLFVDSDVPELLVDGLGRASPLDEPEACIYGYGAVRFLANASIATPKEQTSTTVVMSGSASRGRQKTLAYRMARHGVVQLMVLHLQMLNEAGASVKLAGQPLHAMFQLSGALRMLAKTPSLCQPPTSGPPCLFSTPPPTAAAPTTPSAAPQILELYEDRQEIQLHLASGHLVRAAEICCDDAEVQTNLVRTLSVLSELPACAGTLAASAARLGILLGPCDGRPKPPVLLVRLAYALGNVMAAEDAARVQFFNNDVAMEYLVQALEFYGGQLQQQPLGVKRAATPTGADSMVDVMVKLVRVVANMSVNAEVGYGLSVRPVLGSVLLRLLVQANAGKRNVSSDIEELLLATLGALHNLSFYQDASTNDDDADDDNDYTAINDSHQKQTSRPVRQRLPNTCMSARLADLSAALCTTLQSGPPAARIEAARVLGNMTRSPVARQALCAAGGLKVLVRHLAGTSADATAADDGAELVGTSCGVLVNLLSDWERRAPFRELRGPYQLRDVLQRAALRADWPLAATVCQALWNFLIDTANIVSALGEAEADYIAGDLAEYLDEESLFGANVQPDERWEHFALVAADLLERIQAESMLGAVSPCASSEEEEDDDDDVDQGVDDEMATRRSVDGRSGSVAIAAAQRIGDAWQGQHFRSWLQED